MDGESGVGGLGAGRVVGVLGGVGEVCGCAFGGVVCEEGVMGWEGDGKVSRRRWCCVVVLSRCIPSFVRLIRCLDKVDFHLHGRLDN